MARTLAELRTLIRERADMTDSTFVADAELTDYINDSIAELHDLLTSVYGSGYNQAIEVVTVPSTASGFIPAGTVELDFRALINDAWVSLPVGRLIRVAAVYGADSVPCRRLDMSNDYIDKTAAAWNEGTDVRYNFIYPYFLAATPGNPALEFFPVPTTDQLAEIRYVIGAPELSGDSDVYTLGFDSFIVLASAIKCLAKQQDDTSELMAELARQTERIKNNAPPKDIGQTYTLLENGYRRDGADYDQDDYL